MPKQERITKKPDNTNRKIQLKSGGKRKASSTEPHDPVGPPNTLSTTDSIPDCFAEGFYTKDRASEANSYCNYLHALISLIENLRLAILRWKQKQIEPLLAAVEERVYEWPECYLLDVTEERRDNLVQQFLLTLAVVKQPSSAEISFSAVFGMLSILNHEYDAAAQYREPSND
jgi:hypothetical protein